MPNSPISVRELAAQYGLLKQSVLKVLRRLGIEPTKRPGIDSRGQMVSYITQEEARLVIESIQSARSSGISQAGDCSISADAALDESGVFYLLALEPKSDPGRFKVGFATSLPERLRQLRCSAPFAEVVATWPCRRLWERTAIESVTEGCERIHTEVFRSLSLASVRERCERFFSVMPKLRDDVPNQV